MLTRIKIDKIKSYIEVEGEQEFVEKIYQDFRADNTPQKSEYTSTRLWIMLTLVLIILVGVVLFLRVGDIVLFSSFLSHKIIFGIVAGLFGLLLRNIYFIGKKEQAGKNLWVQYIIKYPLFIVFSSLFVFSILNLNDKIEQSYLFYSFALPLNIYIGLETYHVTEWLEKLMQKYLT